jgi:hypothetical protein
MPPATNGTPPSATSTVKSTGVLAVTGVEIDTELFEVLASLALDTVAEASTEAPWNWFVPTAVVNVIAGKAPPAATGAGLVHNLLAESQLQPLPDALCGAVISPNSE